MMEERKENQTVDDLKLLLAEVIGEVQNRINSVMKKYGISYLEVKEYLAKDNKELFESIGLAEDSIDTDILTKVSKGKDASEEYQEWKRCLMDWQHLVMEAVNAYEGVQGLSYVA